MKTTSIRKLTPDLFVEEIEPCIAFWRDRLGFQVVAEVPEGDRLGFAILSNGEVELMYQTWESLENDVPGVTRKTAGRSTGLFIEVSDLDAIARALEGVDHAFPRRRTFYGMDEIGVREPGGHIVIFAQPAETSDK
ncbi:MAG TPA: VOC family protein [Gemmatimonadaceae bacterium]|jgi:catechol 2,3-dioxygenase-like lactoylglutathione lyase family enzyme|nr:VOC family protein [Gemmatimonadaceae bacterium]